MPRAIEVPRSKRVTPRAPPAARGGSCVLVLSRSDRGQRAHSRRSISKLRKLSRSSTARAGRRPARPAGFERGGLMDLAAGAWPAPRAIPSPAMVMAMRVQLQLYRLGYYGGPVDRRMTPQMRTAFREFQRSQGL